MPPTHLPHKDSPDIHLVVGTADEIAAQTIANSDEWRGALSLEAYLRREEALLGQTLTKDGGLTAWMLVYQPPDSSERQVLCGCESIKKKALLARDGTVEDVVAHGIASVFCPPSNRGKGYARRMMQELGPRLKKWQVDEGVKDNAFSVLYSDIGKQFYTARGWQPFPSSHIALPATATGKKPLIRVDPIPDGQTIARLCGIDERLIRKRMEKTRNDGKHTVALVPDAATVAWHHARQDFIATELNHGIRPSFLDDGNGASVELSSGETAWCYWTRVWTNPQEDSPDTLHIMRLAIDDEEFTDFDAASEDGAAAAATHPVTSRIAALLAAAQKAAFSSGMKQVEIWNPTSTTLAAARMIQGDATVVHRDSESIASLQWYGDGDWRDVNWICCEKYGWC